MDRPDDETHLYLHIADTVSGALRIVELFKSDGDLYLEANGFLPQPAEEYLLERQIERPSVRVPRGTLWPRLNQYHVDLKEFDSETFLDLLNDDLYSVRDLVVYDENRIIAAIYDVGTGEMSVSLEVDEPRREERIAAIRTAGLLIALGRSPAFEPVSFPFRRLLVAIGALSSLILLVRRKRRKNVRRTMADGRG